MREERHVVHYAIILAVVSPSCVRKDEMFSPHLRAVPGHKDARNTFPVATNNQKATSLPGES